jgi:hypothetical protein
MGFFDNTDNNIPVEPIRFCGYEWIKVPGGRVIGSENSSLFSYEGYLSNDDIGSLFITANAFRILNEQIGLHYKVISLIYELRTSAKAYSIGIDERDLLKGPTSNDGFVSCTVDNFLKMFPVNFMEIQHRSLLSLYRIYPNYGQFIRKVEEFHFFAKDNPELGFILSSLIAKEYLEGDVLWNGDGSCRFKAPYKITMNGWLEIEKSIHKNNSYQVFIAMSFDDKLIAVRNSIKKAIVDAGLIPLVIDEIEHTNYIPLEIQNKIKSCGFMVADFTTQNHGAYFEAGYAMGKNIPVVWCCKDDDKQNLHFDIRQYNNILWDNEEYLYNRLLKRLIALKG